MQQHPLPATKLYIPPIRSEQVSRPHLIEKLNTVKVHTRDIYGKLGVNNRTQAVAPARVLGVLPNI